MRLELNPKKKQMLHRITLELERCTSRVTRQVIQRYSRTLKLRLIRNASYEIAPTSSTFVEIQKTKQVILNEFKAQARYKWFTFNSNEQLTFRKATSTFV